MKSKRLHFIGFIAIVSVLTVVVSACAKKAYVYDHKPTYVPQASATVISFTTSTPEPTSEPTPTPTPVPRLADDYTFAWMTDTQHYSHKNNGVFETMTDYLKANKDALDLRYIFFTGDLVHEREKNEEWMIADRAMQTIDDIPNGVLAGNHDVGTKTEEYDYQYFEKYFSESRYRDKQWYGESYKNNRGHYDLLSFGKTDYIFVYLGFQIEDDDIVWAKSAFDRYPERVGILCVHGYLDTDMTLLTDGVRLREQIVKPCKNVFIVLCGHRYTSGCIQRNYDDDGDGIAERTVYEMIANYQAIGDKSSGPLTGGDGYMRFFDIKETTGMIDYYSYSPYLDDYTYFDDPKHQKEKYSFAPDTEYGSFPIPWTYLYRE